MGSGASSIKKNQNKDVNVEPVVLSRSSSKTQTNNIRVIPNETKLDEIEKDITDGGSSQPLSPNMQQITEIISTNQLRNIAIGKKAVNDDKREYDIKAARNIGNKVISNDRVHTPTKKLLPDEIKYSSKVIKTNDYGSVNNSYPTYDTSRSVVNNHKHPKAPPVKILDKNSMNEFVDSPQLTMIMAPSSLPLMKEAIDDEPDLTENYMYSTNGSNLISHEIVKSPIDDSNNKYGKFDSPKSSTVHYPTTNVINMSSKDFQSVNKETKNNDLDSIDEEKGNDDSDNDDEQIYDWINETTANKTELNSQVSIDSSLFGTFNTPDNRTLNKNSVPSLHIPSNDSQTTIEKMKNIGPLVLKSENTQNITNLSQLVNPYSPSIGNKSSRSPNRSPVNGGPGPISDYLINSAGTVNVNAAMNSTSSLQVLHPIKNNRNLIPSNNFTRKNNISSTNNAITNSHAVKETKDVKRNVIDLPTQMFHEKPTTGDWISKRYFVNNYILIQPLGKGSYGEVRLCRERTSDQLYAMKIISKDLMKKRKNVNSSETYFEDIKREIAIMKKLLHPNVLRLYEVLDDPKVNKLYLVLEYMSKGDLINYLKEKDDKTDKKSKVLKVTLTDMELWNIFRQVVSGLRYLHYQNIVHGDIKPQNLLVGNDGIVKIADFGISKMLHTPGEKLNDAAGTPAFMSPELTSGENFSGQLADVWALGATMYMLKFGHPPFVAKTIINLYNKIQNDPLIFPSKIDSNLEDLFTKMLTKNPASRITLEEVTQHEWLRTPPITKSTSDSNFSPPLSYLNEEKSVMDDVRKLSIGNEEVFNSITVGSLVNKDDNSGSTDSDNENILQTNWGNDVFNIVQADSMDSSNDDSDDNDSLNSAVTANRIMKQEEEERRLKRFQVHHTKKSNSELVKPIDNHTHALTSISEKSPRDSIKTPSNMRVESTFSRAEEEDLDELSMEAFENLMDTLARQPKNVQNLSTDNNKDEIQEKLVLDTNLLSTPSSRNTFNGVTIDYYTEQGLRDSQEDRCVSIINLYSKYISDSNSNTREIADLLQKYSLVGIFDGHNGSKCSNYLSIEYPKQIIQNIISFHKNSTEAFKDTSKYLDEQVCNMLRESDDPSGSTGVLALYDGKKRLLTVASVGDSMCVLSRAGRAVIVHNMHRLDNVNEYNRVIKSGAMVMNNRVNGILAITRAYGDVPFKDSIDSITNGPVISIPEVYTEIITPAIEFGVLASDGLWDVITPQDVISFVRRKLNSKISLKEITRLLTLEALREGSIDNVTIAIITFGIPSVTP